LIFNSKFNVTPDSEASACRTHPIQRIPKMAADRSQPLRAMRELLALQTGGTNRESSTRMNVVH
jgi:hypothetical protein